MTTKITYTEKGISRDINESDYIMLWQFLNQAFTPPTSPLSDMGIIETGKLREKRIFKGYVATGSGTISMRDVPSAKGRIITELPKRTKGDVYSIEGYPDWYKFCPDGSSDSGYVPAEYIKEFTDSADIKELCILADSVYGADAKTGYALIEEWLYDMEVSSIEHKDNSTTSTRTYTWKTYKTVNGKYGEVNSFKINGFKCNKLVVSYSPDKGITSLSAYMDINEVGLVEHNARKLLASIVAEFGDPLDYHEFQKDGKWSISGKFSNTPFTKGTLRFNFYETKSAVSAELYLNFS